MSIESYIAIFSGIAAVIAAICSVVTITRNQQKEDYENGKNDGDIRGDIKYMRNSFDELRLDVREVVKKLDSQGERITRVEESYKQLDSRVDAIERRLNHSAEE